MKSKHTTKKGSASQDRETWPTEADKQRACDMQVIRDSERYEWADAPKGSVTPDPDSRPGWKLVKNNDNVGPKYSWVLDQPGSELRADEVCWTEGGDADCLIHPKPAAEHSNKGSGDYELPWTAERETAAQYELHEAMVEYQKTGGGALSLPEAIRELVARIAELEAQ